MEIAIIFPGGLMEDMRYWRKLGLNMTRHNMGMTLFAYILLTTVRYTYLLKGPISQRDYISRIDYC